MEAERIAREKAEAAVLIWLPPPITAVAPKQSGCAVGFIGESELGHRWLVKLGMDNTEGRKATESILTKSLVARGVATDAIKELVAAVAFRVCVFKHARRLIDKLFIGSPIAFTRLYVLSLSLPLMHLSLSICLSLPRSSTHTYTHPHPHTHMSAYCFTDALLRAFRGPGGAAGDD